MSLNIHVLTISPEIFEGFLGHGMVRKAVDKKLLEVVTVDIRAHAKDRHRTVDDKPYGGGAGMVMKPDVLAESLKATEPYRKNRSPRVIYLTPQGKVFNQTMANELSLEKEFVLVCGRYRDIDERFRKLYVTEEISVGDYVLSGGEPAAAIIIDAVARLIPGVLGDFESGMEDSFQDGLLDCPWYTTPDVFEGEKVPEVLLSGNHALIKKWRMEESLRRTKERRPDLLDKDYK